MCLRLFPGSAIEAALPSGMGSKWVRFNGNVLNIKNKMASLSSIFPAGTGYDAGGIGLSREAMKCGLPYVLARAASQERGISNETGRLGVTDRLLRVAQRVSENLFFNACAGPDRSSKKLTADR